MVTEALDTSVIDEVVEVEDGAAFRLTRELARLEGILAGGTSGAALWACLEVGKKLTGPAVMVTVFPDTGLRYLSRYFNDEWMETSGYLTKKQIKTSFVR
jgi:cystathionine beta-synthase/cysteine synthase A